MPKLEDTKTKLIGQKFTLGLPLGNLEKMQGVHEFVEWLIENDYQIKPKNDDYTNQQIKPL